MTPAAAKLAARIAAVLLLAAGICVLWWALFIRPGQLKQANVNANAGAVVATGEAAKAADAAKIVESTHEIQRTIERQTITNARIIRAAPGAGDPVAAARAIVRMVHAGAAPLRLVLGAYAEPHVGQRILHKFAVDADPLPHALRAFGEDLEDVLRRRVHGVEDLGQHFAVH